MENLTYKKETVYKKCDKAIIDAAYAYAEGYKTYLDALPRASSSQRRRASAPILSAWS